MSLELLALQLIIPVQMSTILFAESGATLLLASLLFAIQRICGEELPHRQIASAVDTLHIRSFQVSVHHVADSTRSIVKLCIFSFSRIFNAISVEALTCTQTEFRRVCALIHIWNIHDLQSLKAFRVVIDVKVDSPSLSAVTYEFKMHNGALHECYTHITVCSSETKTSSDAWVKKALVKASICSESGEGCIGSGWDERREKQICISFLNFEQAGTRSRAYNSEVWISWHILLTTA